MLTGIAATAVPRASGRPSAARTVKSNACIDFPHLSPTAAMRRMESSFYWSERAPEGDGDAASGCTKPGRERSRPGFGTFDLPPLYETAFTEPWASRAAAFSDLGTRASVAISASISATASAAPSAWPARTTSSATA
jgi:hypothetical protein